MINKLHKVQPFDTDFTSVGGAYNLALSELQAHDEDWILLMDWDAVILRKSTYELIYKIIDSAPDDTGIIGAMTNRIGLKYQLYDGEFSNNFNIQLHRLRAKKLEEQNITELKSAKRLAGFCMLFKYERWHEVEGFKQNRFFDVAFSNDMRKLKYNNYIATGLYVFHQYRPWKMNQTEAHQDYAHIDERNSKNK